MPTTQQDKNIGQRLRAYRKAAKLTQEDVGKALGVSFQQIQKYENGKNRLSGSRMLVALKLLKVDADQLLGTDGGKSTHNNSFDLLTDTAVQRVLDVMRPLPHEARVLIAAAVVAFGKLCAFGTMNRTCGNCQLCCKLLPMKRSREDPRWSSTVAAMTELGVFRPGESKNWLEEFDNAAGLRCPHQRHHKGCKVYATRPFGCRTWSCRWLVDDDTAAMHRPDRSHFVIDTVPDYVRGGDADGNEQIIPVIQVWLDPDFPDAFRDPELRAYLSAQKSAAIVRLNNRDAFFVVGPPLAESWIEIRAMTDEPEHTAEEKVAALGGMTVTLKVAPMDRRTSRNRRTSLRRDRAGAARLCAGDPGRGAGRADLDVACRPYGTGRRALP